MRNTIEYYITGKSNLAAVSQAHRAFTSLGLSISGVGRGLSGMVAGLGATLSAGGIIAALTSAAKTGVGFNATIEDSRLGIAALIRQFDSARFPTFDAALSKSSELIEQMKVSALTLKGSFTDLLQAYTALSGPMYSANVPLERQVKLATLLAQAVAGIGLDQGGRLQYQLATEGRALLTGQMNAGAQLARIMMPTPKDRAEYQTALAQGRVLDWLETRLKAFAEAGDRAAMTFSGAWSNAWDKFQQVTGAGFMETFEQLKSLAFDVQKALGSDEFKESLNSVSKFASSLIRVGRDLIPLLAKFGSWTAEKGTQAVDRTSRMALGLKAYSPEGFSGWLEELNPFKKSGAFDKAVALVWNADFADRWQAYKKAVQDATDKAKDNPKPATTTPNKPIGPIQTNKFTLDVKAQTSDLNRNGIFAGATGWLASMSQQNATKETNRLLSDIKGLLSDGLQLADGSL